MATCFFNGCDADAADGWRCFFHRGRNRCSVQACHNQAYARQLCARHGGKLQCRFAGCTSRSRTGAHCTKHGSTRVVSVCSHDGCSHAAQLRGLCVKHGGGRYCKMDGCTTFARSGGFCARHTRLLREIFQTAQVPSYRIVDKIVDVTFVEAFRDDFTTTDFDDNVVDVDILDIIMNM